MFSEIAAVPLCIWSYLLWGRGGFWKVADKLAPDAKGVLAPDAKGLVRPDRVVAVIPARNEAPLIAETLASLLAQHISIVLVDDNSTDDPRRSRAQRRGRPVARSD